MITCKKFTFSSFLIVCALNATCQKITTSFTPEASATSFSGKVFLYLSKDAKAPKD
jgi:hypothetical protein